ncbi:hypothetical protein OAF42_00115 [Planctomicrobium sp.]|nr:hypothetical protein [Planctomicrobium sp.]MDB4732823.1 hypothetical protein [Planctomicrobium sp.]
MKQFVDDQVGYVLEVPAEEQLTMIHDLLCDPPFTWIVEIHPP